ncbi:Gluconate 2-dehydrogenase subunit 3 [Methylobacterium sp. UNC300MFChir4.1]|uniref:gluconate 2-dehydrogenase subunit 3 family protein n=1 Tax=Methylobacterium sp. UNC300MFChir4.1 TaxID=1502747 RepID=UPI0008BF6130|nr:gluconate 2-dehydrogenase subunit 3 family protein [Methylobacterium sp. UNC300MFChir4.1]SEO73811.1 Gluconate 2-dehydrogenase subunit 3 [Methylobacterium sp. UNC300MFChir4.1]
MQSRKDLFPGYNVLAKRDTPSWNPKTRSVIDERLAITPRTHRFLDATEFATLLAVAGRIVPQPAGRTDPVPAAAMVDHKLASREHDGYRQAGLPEQGAAWRLGLKALDAEARAAFGAAFGELGAWAQDTLLKACEDGSLRGPAWDDMPSDLFFKKRLIPDLVKAYYAHPTAWNEIGWGGPASPRGYVRMDFDRRDPWEAAEAKPGREDEAYQENLRVGR